MATKNQTRGNASTRTNKSKNVTSNNVSAIGKELPQELNAESSKSLSIVPYLYEANTLIDLLKAYSVDLRNTGSLEDMLHANKLDEVRSILEDNRFFKVIRRHHKELYVLTKKNFPSLKFSLEGRRKSIISAEKKINLYLAQGRTLDEFRDILAFRFVLYNGSIKDCYDLMENIIRFNIENGFIPCKATTIETSNVDRKDLSKVFPGIEVPEKSFLTPEYSEWVKDYILNPKKSGYQSLHCGFQAPQTGRFFEVQIRTFQMHIHAESHPQADHEAYKKDRYSSMDFDFDRSRIHMDGYAYANGVIFDDIGLEKPYKIIEEKRPF